MRPLKMEEFKIRCSAIGHIMGRVGLTDKQEADFQTYDKRAKGEGKPLTGNQEKTYRDLKEKKENPKLPDTCTSYLKTWYSEQKYGRFSDIQTKYTKKGHLCEDEAIDEIGLKFGGFGERMLKNEQFFENEWTKGTPDVISKIIYDAKCPWDGKTFLDSVISPNNPLYIWQMRGYMWLTDLPEAKVCYVLLDTPEEANYGEEVVFSQIPIEERMYHFEVKRDLDIESDIRERVKLCRKWLKNYDLQVKEKLKC